MTRELPSTAESVQAREMCRLFDTRTTTAPEPLSLRFPGDLESPLPAPVEAALRQVLEQTARGKAVNVVPVEPELTTQGAADMLLVSRPTLIQLLDAGEIEYRKVGSHRRVLLTSVLDYQQRLREKRLAALAALSAHDQELGL